MKFPIKVNSQQEFDSLLIDRLNENENRYINKINEERAIHQQKIDDLKSQINNYKEQLNDFNEQVNLLNQKQLEIDRLKATYKNGLPLELSNKLKGNTFNELDIDACKMAFQLSENKQKENSFIPPTPNPDFYFNSYGDGIGAEFEKLNPGITKFLKEMEEKRFK